MPGHRDKATRLGWFCHVLSLSTRQDPQRSTDGFLGLVTFLAIWMAVSFLFPKAVASNLLAAWDGL